MLAMPKRKWFEYELIRQAFGFMSEGFFIFNHKLHRGVRSFNLWDNT